MSTNVGINLNTKITVYPEQIPGIIQEINDYLPFDRSYVENMKEEGQAYSKQLNKLLVQMLWLQLRSTGMFSRKSFMLAELKAEVISFNDFYTPWLNETIELFVRSKYLTRSGHTYSVNQASIPIEDQILSRWADKKKQWIQDPNMNAQINLVESTLWALPDLITGKRSATEVIFPNSSMNLVEGIYKNNKVADYFNEALANFVVAYVEKRIELDSEVKINIFEVGAGTGGTSNIIFKKLEPFRKHIGEYCYTDLSRAFFSLAEQQYSTHYDYITYKIFDVEKPVLAQGIKADNFDLVIAANVLHATRDINTSIENVKAILRHNGVILLNEISQNTLFTHLTFGLLEGWWLAQDRELRIPGSPGLFPDTWKNVLEIEGFEQVSFPTHSAHELGQQIVLAQSDGIVKQKEQSSLKPIAPSAPRAKKQLETEEKSSQANQNLLQAKTVEFLTQLISRTLKIPADTIDSFEPLETYGIDSILIIQLNNAFNEIFEELSNTIFFEYQTIEALSNYFVENREEELRRLFNNNDSTEKLNGNPIATTKTEASGHSVSKNKRTFKKKSFESTNTNSLTDVNEPIAIIGMSGRYPMAANLEEFWDNLKNGKDCVSEIPAERWSLENFYCESKQEALTEGKSYSKWGAFLENFAEFDPLFFNISPKEAVNIDPQERLFMQSCWEVFEDAGYTRHRLSTDFNNRIGIFTGITRTGFELYGPELWKKGIPLFPHTSFSSVANRVSYFFNLKGPSLAFDTMCSSSLTAIHEACQHLRQGECEMAVAGGVNLYLHPSSYRLFSLQQMLSSDGKCKSFGKGGNGFVPGEGVGAILLKPLSKAIKDNDNIYAVIRASSINHGGKTNGYTVPNPMSQGDLIRETLDKASINARTVSYIEAHGTGTELGDPIEITGLSQAFEKDTLVKQFCAIGSLKSNIGHCEAAAGIAGLTKVVLQMKHKQLVPSLHTAELNPNINFEKTPFKVQQNLTSWLAPLEEINDESRELPRIAGVSSFGAGGANAHVILEEYDEEEQPSLTERSQTVVFVLSAKNKEALKKYAEEMLRAINQKGLNDSHLQRIMYTLLLRREAMEERLAIVLDNILELKEKLSTFVKDEKNIANLYSGRANRKKAADGEVAIKLNEYLFEGKLDDLAKFWCEGQDMDYEELYRDAIPRNISLPTYPFANEYYWLPNTNDEEKLPELFEAKNTVNQLIETKVEEIEPLEVLSFTERWKEESLPNAKSAHLKTVLCFADNALSQELIANQFASCTAEDRPNLLFVSHHNLGTEIDTTNHIGIDRTLKQAYEKLFSDLEHLTQIDTIWYLWPQEERILRNQYSEIFLLFQAITTAKLKVDRLLIAGAYDSFEEYCYVSSWIGFERSIKQIVSRTKVKLVLQKAGSMSEWVEKFWKEQNFDTNQTIWYKENTRLVSVIEPTFLANQASSAIKQDGYYVITGGMGSLALVFADYLAKVYQANLILIGRSPLNEKNQTELEKLKRYETSVTYFQGDISNLNSMQELSAKLKLESIKINGILHMAGVPSHTALQNKNLADLQEVLSPKVRGTEVLNETFVNDELDFFCAFSSSSAILGDFGSCDYAVANRYQMDYATYQNEQHNKTKFIAINWPLWRSGGMHFESKHEESYLKLSGQAYLEIDQGIKVWEQLLMSDDLSQLIIVGQKNRVHQFLGIGQWSKPLINLEERTTYSEENRRLPIMKGWDLKECLHWELKEQINQLLGIERERINNDVNFIDFGFDSIVLMQFAQALSTMYTIDVSPSVFFEHTTIDDFASYLLNEYHDTLSKFYSEEKNKSDKKDELFSGSDTKPVENNQKDSVTNAENLYAAVDEPIAIIGMSGRFPNARNIHQMWEILEKGENAVTEIPIDRWDWRQYYSETKIEGKINSKWIGHIPGTREFDPLFFEISPLEAQYMDPRQRLLLQEACGALEDAGYGEKQLKENKIGLFVGAEEGEYQLVTSGRGSITSNHTAMLSARIAYFLNLNGPNLTVNTACSSGLVAAHQACQSLISGECDTAMAAGVNLILTPMAYLQMTEAGMLSTNGKCATFDADANGIVPGEAVVVLVLKRLSKALKDGDPVHAVIKGSGINYDGKTNGITAPSGAAQVNLLQNIYDRYQINPQDIKHVAAHGTGTKLGDPIEVNALRQAFKKYTSATAYCALTSSKTNFGHTFAASGLVNLVGLVKGLQQNKIPASLNCKTENEFINLDNSHFYVNKITTPWPEGVNKKRMGALSSFGMSGTNAHMVVENYDLFKSSKKRTKPFYLLLLSAKTENALLERVQDMIQYLQSSDAKDADLMEISYTLQAGRQHFSHRCAIVIQDVENAISAWKHVGKKDKLPNVFQRICAPDFVEQVSINKYAHHLMQEIALNDVEASTYKEGLFALAELYCQGYEFSWAELYGTQPSRIHLPTYPFEREEYWASADDLPTISPSKKGSSLLHPLLQQNTSTLEGICFASIFNGNEPFLSDHKVQQGAVLPGVAYLEMARTAIEYAVKGDEDENQKELAIKLNNVVWVRPWLVGVSAPEIRTKLFLNYEDQIDFEMITEEKEAIVHCQGTASLLENLEERYITIPEVKEQCAQTILSGKQCYDVFEEMEVSYGVSHRLIEQVYVGNNQLLVELSLPESLKGQLNEYTLHPGILDAALQGVVGFLLASVDISLPQNRAILKPKVPFALRELVIHHKCSSKMFAFVRYCEGTDQKQNVQKFDVDICDENGKVCVQFKEFATRSLENELGATSAGSKLNSLSILDNSGKVYLKPVWDTFTGEEVNYIKESKVLVVSIDEVDRKAIQKYYPEAQFIQISSENTVTEMVDKFSEFKVEEIIYWSTTELLNCEVATSEEQINPVITCFRFIKALLQHGYDTQPLAWTIFTNRAQAVLDDEQADPAQAAIHGLIGSMAKEYTNWKIRLVDVENILECPLEQVFKLPYETQGNAYLYRNQQWLSSQLVSYRPSGSVPNLLKMKGVYVIIGGAGGIGEIVSKFLITTYHAQVIWIGRRQLDDEIQNKIDTLGKLGTKPIYLAADATNEKLLQEAYKKIKKQFSAINAVIHSAIDLCDQRLAKMDEATFRAGLTAKADVSINIAKIFKNEHLDFALFFSSMTSFTKAAGQSNYAAGCTFKDSYAQQLLKQWTCPVKVINWGYWGSVGIVASEQYKERMAMAGFASIEPEDGIEAIKVLLAEPVNQLAFIKINRPIGTMGLKTDEAITSYLPLTETGGSQSPNRVPLTGKLKAAIANFLAVSIDDIDESTTWSEYGLDGSKQIEFEEYLHKQFDTVDKPFNLIEYTSLGCLTAYLSPSNSMEEKEATVFIDRDTIASIETNLVPPAMEMDELLGRLLFAVLKENDFLNRNEDAVDDRYSHWMEHSINLLVERNYLSPTGKELEEIESSSKIWNDWDSKKKAWLSNPNLKAQVILVETTLKALSGIMKGERLATDVMFPESSMKMVEGVYRDNLVADYFNEILANQLLLLIEAKMAKDPRVKIRILEIGAGTGGTSILVFDKLKKYQNNIEEYCYTDISKAFLLYAEKTFEAGPSYIKYRLFDVEKPIASQGIAANSYDFVIATNVLHATKNIRQSLRNAKAALHCKGQLLLNELGSNTLFSHLTFGLLEGWWRYEDNELRISGSPILSSKMWSLAMKNEGFYDIEFPALVAQQLGQQIVLAKSDGIIRQKVVDSQFVNGEGVSLVKEVVKSPVAIAQNTGINTNIPAGAVRPYELREKGILYFKELFFRVLKIPIHRIDAVTSFESYGIDSIMVIQLNNALEEVFENVSSTLFFEYQTIEQLTDYFIETQRDNLAKIVNLQPEQKSTNLPNLAVNIDNAPYKTVSLSRGLNFSREKETKTLNEEKHRPADRDSIAIIGVQGKYAQADNLMQFWNNLKSGKNCITEIPEDRWDWKKYFSNEKGEWGTHYTKWGGFIKDIDKFDPLFFRIAPTEVARMDPQERLFLEIAYTAVQDAGYTPQELNAKKKVGVFVGVMNGNYPSGTSFHSIANRVSYVLDFQGPSLAVDTACSSSLTAIHLAIESLRGGSCEVAIAGGVNLIVDPVHYSRLCAMGMLSVDDKCKAFSNDADGFVDGEGVGAVVLKPLSKAILDKDHIYGVIKGSAINAGGKTNGYTVPNPNAQASAISDALERAGVKPEQLSYVETHGTGTVLGDPIEMAGLSKAFASATTEKQFCAIGSVKSNIGHCESAAGIAGLTKILLQMKHKQLVPSLNIAELNTKINFGQTPFSVQQELSEWNVQKFDGNTQEKILPRIAGISSFGAGGSNAHLIIEEYPIKNTPINTLEQNIVVLSAKTKESLKAYAHQLLIYLDEEMPSDDMLPSIAFTLQVGREVMTERMAFIADSIEELTIKLKGYLEGLLEEIYEGSADNIGETISLFSTDEELQQTLLEWLKRKKYNKFLDLWVRGLAFDWWKIYTQETPQRISLPTYSFSKARYWLAPLETTPDLGSFIQESETKADGMLVENKVINLTARLLGLQEDVVSLSISLSEYGMDSILFMQLVQRLQAYISPAITVRHLEKCNTLNDIVEAVKNIEPILPAQSPQAEVNFVPKAWPQFPELVLLNEGKHGRPVFWFHAGAGGVEIYQDLARYSSRPFYGIQARGYMTERAPLNGIQAMAAYYSQIIKAIQPNGPYDLGGYSLGGLTAYEVTRQLQEMGDKVESVVMLDTLIGPELKNATFNKKDALLQTVNMQIFTSLQSDPEKLSNELIHCEELNKRHSPANLLKQLISIANKRGYIRDNVKGTQWIDKTIQVQEAFEASSYVVKPLLRPEELTCYYFRNQSGLFLGELRPYFSIDPNKTYFDHGLYWQEWEQLFVNFQLYELDTPNHMMILTDLKSLGTIKHFFGTIYG